MIIEKEIAINKSIETVWKVLGLEFADAYKWASAVNHSEGKGNGINGASCSERGCTTSMGKLRSCLVKV